MTIEVVNKRSVGVQKGSAERFNATAPLPKPGDSISGLTDS